MNYGLAPVEVARRFQANSPTVQETILETVVGKFWHLAQGSREVYKYMQV